MNTQDSLSSKLGSLFVRKPKNIDDREENKRELITAVVGDKEVDFHTYEEWGFKQAGLCTGEVNVLQNAMDVTKSIFINEANKDKVRQEKYRLPIQKEIDQLHAEQKENGERSERIEKQIEVEKEKIEKWKQERIKAHQNPKSVPGYQEHNPLTIYIGWGLLIFLAVYLFLFYSSAAYSAFFRNFSEEDNVGRAIFDPQAMSKAWGHGGFALALILTIPFIFLGLGFLIHIYQEKKKGIRQWFLLGATFILDVLFAYHITARLHDARSENSFEEIANLSVAEIIFSVDFWIIIFAGFVVYLIWGFLFDVVMEGMSAKGVVNRYVDGLDRQIQDVEGKIQSKENELEAIAQANSEKRIRIVGLERELTSAFYQPSDLSKELHNFFIGWSNWLTGAGMKGQIAQHKQVFQAYHDKLVSN